MEPSFQFGSANNINPLGNCMMAQTSKKNKSNKVIGDTQIIPVKNTAMADREENNFSSLQSNKAFASSVAALEGNHSSSVKPL